MKQTAARPINGQLIMTRAATNYITRLFFRDPEEIRRLALHGNQADLQHAVFFEGVDSQHPAADGVADFVFGVNFLPGPADDVGF